jgi:hypothetical protein
MSDDISQAEPTPDAPAEPEPQVTTPEPEPEPEPITPDWLTDAGKPPEPEPEPPVAPTVQDWQVPATQTPAVSYQQPTQTPPAQPAITDANVDAYVDQRAQQIANRMFEEKLGPIAYQLQQMDGRTSQFVQAQADSAVAQAQSNIGNAYKEVFSKDEAFRGNEAVRQQVEETLQGMFNQAAESARQGYPQQLMMFQHPAFYNTFLAAAKAYAGYQPPAVEPLAPAGAVTETGTPKAEETPIELSSDLEDVAREYGLDREKIKKGLKESKERGDFDPWS